MKEILKFLSNLGVDTRFISIFDEQIFINNLKFSRFSRRREELFQARYTKWDVIRSKVFQKMCIRASRVLSKSLKPGDTISILKGTDCADRLLYLILEPYQRKYGIKIIYEEDLELTKSDSFASSQTLDREVAQIIKQIFNGERIHLTTLKNKGEVIYPLINIPDSWIEIWARDNHFLCSATSIDKKSEELLKFLEPYIPDVMENMVKSAFYLSK